MVNRHAERGDLGIHLGFSTRKRRGGGNTTRQRGTAQFECGAVCGGPHAERRTRRTHEDETVGAGVFSGIEGLRGSFVRASSTWFTVSWCVAAEAEQTRAGEGSSAGVIAHTWCPPRLLDRDEAPRLSWRRRPS